LSSASFIEKDPHSLKENEVITNEPTTVVRKLIGVHQDNQIKKKKNGDK